MNAPGYHFRPLPRDAAIPEPWRALDRAVARWVLIHGGSPLLAEQAGWASFADGQGDAALVLTGDGAGRHGAKALDESRIRALEKESLVCVAGSDGRAPGNAPFVLDGERFYLRRNHSHETAVAAQLSMRLQSVPGISAPVDETDLDVLFQQNNSDAVQAQRQAVRAVASTRLFVLTGGPGTGKTTTVLRMLVMLARQRERQGEARPTIRIAAPTGKAAQRLAQSLRDGSALLAGHAHHPLPEDWRSALDAALRAQASTLHRLLGSRGTSGGFRYHANQRLPADIVVVDEASMLDLDMLHALLQALREDTTLILVGDADQLASVGTGSVLADLVSALATRQAPQLVRLQHGFRAVAPLSAINRAILAGEPQHLLDAWQAAGDHVRLREVTSITGLRAALAQWCGELQAQLRRIGVFDPASGDDEQAAENRAFSALAGLRQRQLLCALREGEFGADAIGQALDEALRRAIAGDDHARWYPGRAVMILRNDAASGLFNGDIGLCLHDVHGHPWVWFEANPTGQSQGSERHALRFAPGSLPEHQSAFAITVHKSQGSEYGHLALLLPPDPGNRILSRQLLYTGVSRARQSLEVWGTHSTLDAALATPIHRTSGLAKRLT
jgi:exodeoxyribonuclease V alpha subunit